MTQAARRTDVMYDHHSAANAADCGAANSALHEHGPVFWSPSYDGFWVATSHEAVSAAERDNATFSSAHDVYGDTHNRGGIVIPPQPFYAIPIELDPPEFHAYRKLLNPYFSPAAAKRWRPFIDQVTAHFLDRISECGSGDLVVDLANPVPGAVTCAILGLPMDDWELIAEPAHEVVYAPPGSELALNAVGKTMRLMAALADAVEERRAAPREDLLSVLATARIDGEPAPIDMLVQTAFLIVFGGVDTTTGLTANALVWLDQHPEHRKNLVEHPETWQKATEEFLRYFTPVQGMARTVTTDTQLAGCPLAAEERILLSFGAANRDPAVFDRPDEVDLERAPNRHTAFGLGIHRCLGSNLARAMFESMMLGVLRRMPDYTVDHDAAKQYQTVGTVNGWECVPATWTSSAPTATPLPEPLPTVAQPEKTR